MLDRHAGGGISLGQGVICDLDLFCDVHSKLHNSRLFGKDLVQLLPLSSDRQQALPLKLLDGEKALDIRVRWLIMLDVPVRVTLGSTRDTTEDAPGLDDEIVWHK